MISKDERNLRRICRNYEQVENYEKAIADEENNYHLHHRRETDEMKSRQQLKDEGRYYNVPSSELIFLTVKEHNKIHSENLRGETRKKKSEAQKGKHHSEEARKKISEAHKGMKDSDEARKKKSEAGKLRVGDKNTFYGKHHSEESLKKISEIKKSKELHWWNNGKISILSKECPGEDFVRGRIKSK